MCTLSLSLSLSLSHSHSLSLSLPLSLSPPSLSRNNVPNQVKISQKPAESSEPAARLLGVAPLLGYENQ